jgi:hypothetical protein
LRGNKERERGEERERVERERERERGGQEGGGKGERDKERCFVLIGMCVFLFLIRRVFFRNMCTFLKTVSIFNERVCSFYFNFFKNTHVFLNTSFSGTHSCS